MAEHIGAIVVIALGSVSVVVVLVTTGYACWQCLSRGGNIIEDRNSGEKAVVYFMRVLGEADERMVVHDDGDDVPGSIYNNEHVLEALERRLRDKPELKVCMLFNNPGVQLKILDLAKTRRDQLQIRYRRRGRPVGDVHYKIADKRMGYFSEHDEGSTYRDIWIYEFQSAPKKACERAFGDHIRRFDSEFAEAQIA